MSNKVFRTIIGVLIIALVLLITITLVKRLPSILKLLAIGANVATIYLVFNKFFKKKKQKEENGN